MFAARTVSRTPTATAWSKAADRNNTWQRELGRRRRQSARFDPLHAAHIRPEGLGDLDATVGLLVVFQDCRKGTADRQTRAVERVEKLRLRPFFRTKPNLRSPGLKILEVAARRDLDIPAVAWHPNLQVIRLGRGKGNVAGAQEHHAVR